MAENTSGVHDPVLSLGEPNNDGELVFGARVAGNPGMTSPAAPSRLKTTLWAAMAMVATFLLGACGGTGIKANPVPGGADAGTRLRYDGAITFQRGAP